MYKIYLTDVCDPNYSSRDENKQFICETETKEETFTALSKIYAQYRSVYEPYVRYLLGENGITADFGSWSNFVYVTPAKGLFDN